MASLGARVTQLASGLSLAYVCRQEVELKLLSLFADTALLARSESQLRCLGMLLLPLARVWGDGSPSSRRSLMSTGSMDFETLKNLRFDTQLTKVPITSLTGLIGLRVSTLHSPMALSCLAFPPAFLVHLQLA